MQESTDAPIFIIGSPRSGTTFLVQLMNRFLDIHVVRDAGVFLRFKGLLPHYDDLSNKNNVYKLIKNLYNDYWFRKRILSRGLNVSEKELLDTFTGNTYSDLVEHIMVTCAHGSGKIRWGNKMPSYALYMADVNDLFPKAKFIHIVRDGRDIVLSCRNSTSLLLDRNWYCAAREWKAHVLAGREYNTLLGDERYLEIRYEELMQYHIKIFTEISNFIGISQKDDSINKFSQEMNKLIKHNNFNKWKYQMPLKPLKIVERTSGDVLQLLGYEVKHPELIGDKISQLHVIGYHLDNIRRKVFAPIFIKHLRRWYKHGVTRMRASTYRLMR